MKFYTRSLPQTQRFPCTKRALRDVFGDSGLSWVSFGKLARHFRFDHRCHHRPRFNGPVVAALTISPDAERYLCLYPVPAASYDDRVREEFASRVLPTLKSWLAGKLLRPQTAPNGYEKIIVEWDRGVHKMHEIRFQTGLERTA